MLKFPVILFQGWGRGSKSSEGKSETQAQVSSCALCWCYESVELTPFAGFNLSFQHYRSCSLYTCGCPAADICVNAIAHMTQAMHRPCLAHMAPTMSRSYLVHMALTIHRWYPKNNVMYNEGDKVDFDVTGISDHIQVSISA